MIRTVPGIDAASSRSNTARPCRHENRSRRVSTGLAVPEEDGDHAPTSTAASQEVRMDVNPAHRSRALTRMRRRAGTRSRRRPSALTSGMAEVRPANGVLRRSRRMTGAGKDGETVAEVGRFMGPRAPTIGDADWTEYSTRRVGTPWQVPAGRGVSSWFDAPTSGHYLIGSAESQKGFWRLRTSVVPDQRRPVRWTGRQRRDPGALREGPETEKTQGLLNPARRRGPTSAKAPRGAQKGRSSAGPRHAEESAPARTSRLSRPRRTSRRAANRPDRLMPCRATSRSKHAGTGGEELLVSTGGSSFTGRRQQLPTASARWATEN